MTEERGKLKFKNDEELINYYCSMEHPKTFSPATDCKVWAQYEFIHYRSVDCGNYRNDSAEIYKAV